MNQKFGIIVVPVFFSWILAKLSFTTLSENSSILEMGTKEQNDNAKVEAVLQLLRKQAPLTVKQVDPSIPTHS